MASVWIKQLLLEKSIFRTAETLEKQRLSAVSLCLFVAYLSLKSAFRYYTIANDTELFLHYKSFSDNFRNCFFHARDGFLHT